MINDRTFHVSFPEIYLFNLEIDLTRRWFDFLLLVSRSPSYVVLTWFRIMLNTLIFSAGISRSLEHAMIFNYIERYEFLREAISTLAVCLAWLAPLTARKSKAQSSGQAMFSRLPHAWISNRWNYLKWRIEIKSTF